MYYTSQGSSGDVRKATLALDGFPSFDSTVVAVKVLRIADDTNLKELARVRNKQGSSTISPSLIPGAS